MMAYWIACILIILQDLFDYNDVFIERKVDAIWEKR